MESGPGATDLATTRALTRVGGAAAVVLVEGISDQIAVETAATRSGRDLAAGRVVIMPIGGAHAVARTVADLGERAPAARLLGLCDRREEPLFRRALPGAPVFVCVDDLEEELIRASAVEEVFAATGDLGLFQLFRKQPAWRGRPVEAQMYRFIRSNSQRNLRYARLLVDAAGTLPTPLSALLDAV